MYVIRSIKHYQVPVVQLVNYMPYRIDREVPFTLSLTVVILIIILLVRGRS